MLDMLSECIKRGDCEKIKEILSLCFEEHPLSDVVRALDQGIDDLAREWYARYDWDGKSRAPNPSVSYREFENAWNAYAVAHEFILSQERELSSLSEKSMLKSFKIGTGTIGNVHKAILRIDLNLRLYGWTVEFLGCELSPQDVLYHEEELDAFVLSVMAHSARVPALNMLMEVTSWCYKPIFVGGTAFKAIDAWIKKETDHVPYFVKEHGISNRDFRDVSEFTISLFNGARYVDSLDDLHRQLLTVLISGMP